MRSPSALARRVIAACDVDDLLGEPASGKARQGTREALGSWVAVPTAPRSDGQAAPAADARARPRWHRQNQRACSRYDPRVRRRVVLTHCFGIWGGLDEDERRGLRRAEQKEAS